MSDTSCTRFGAGPASAVRPAPGRADRRWTCGSTSTGPGPSGTRCPWPWTGPSSRRWPAGRRGRRR